MNMPSFGEDFMYEESGSRAFAKRYSSRIFSLAACLFASSQVTAAAAPSMPDVNSLSNSPTNILLRESVSRSRFARVKVHSGAATKTNHLYYLVYTSEAQTARGDFAARKISISAERGSIVATDGQKVKVISGLVHFSNQGASSLSILNGAVCTSLEPGQEANIGNSNIKQAENNAQLLAVASAATVIPGKVEYKHSKAVTANEPARVWAEESCQFGVTSAGVIELLRGQVIVSSSQASQIHTLAGSVDCDPLSLVICPLLRIGSVGRKC